MKKSALVLPTTLVLLAATATTISWAHQGTRTGPPLNQLIPGPLAHANFGKIISGDFTGDLKRDAVLMDGSQPKLLVTPEVHASAIAMGGPANDIAVISGFVPGRDSVLAVSSAGLLRYERNSPAPSWTTTPIRGPGSNWTAALAVASGRLNANGGPDIAGVSANGHDILILYGQANGSFISGATFSANGQNIYGLFLLNWREAGDTAGTDEIAVLSSYGVEIYEPNGTPLAGIAWTHPLMGTVINDQGTVLQRLAMVSPVSGTDQWYVFGSVKCEGPVAMGPACTVSMAAGDADNDGDSEVFLGVNNERVFKELPNHSPEAMTFDVTNPVRYSYGPSLRNPALNRAGLAPADFDCDGSLDVLAPAQGDLISPVVVTGTVPLVSVGLTSPSAYRTSVSSAELIEVQGVPDRIELTLKDPGTRLTAEPNSEVKFSVMVWYTADLTSRTLGAPIQAELVSLPGLPGGTTTFSLKLPGGYSISTDPALFSVVIRQVVVTATPSAVVKVAPAYIGIVAGGSSWPVLRDAGDTLVYEFVMGEDPTETPDGGVAVGPTVPGVNDDIEPVDEDPKP